MGPPTIGLVSAAGLIRTEIADAHELRINEGIRNDLQPRKQRSNLK